MTATEATTIVTGVDFVSIPTQDLARAVEFYGTTLGLEREVYMPERNFAEFDTGHRDLQRPRPREDGHRRVHAEPAPPRAARRGRGRRAHDARGARRDVHGRHLRHRRLPHGVLQRPRRERADAAPPLREAGDRGLKRSTRVRASSGITALLIPLEPGSGCGGWLRNSCSWASWRWTSSGAGTRIPSGKRCSVQKRNVFFGFQVTSGMIQPSSPSWVRRRTPPVARSIW